MSANLLKPGAAVSEDTTDHAYVECGYVTSNCGVACHHPRGPWPGSGYCDAPREAHPAPVPADGQGEAQ